MQGHRRPPIWLRSDGQENYVQNIEYLNSVPGEMIDTLSVIQTNSIELKCKDKNPMRYKRITYNRFRVKRQERT